MEEKSNFVLCPRCNHQVSSDKTECPFCNVDLSIVNEGPESLNFALTEETSLINLSTTEQVLSKSMQLNRKITNILMIIVGFLSFCILFYPLYSYGNFYSHLVAVSTNSNGAYNLVIDSGLEIVSGKTTFIGLMKSGISYFLNNGFEISTSFLLAGHELLVSGVCLAVATLSVILIVLGIKSLISTQDYKYYLNISGTIFALGLILIFGFDAFGFGTFFVMSINFLYLIYIYLAGILTKEKKFKKDQLILKSFTICLLLSMLILSSIGSIDLVVDLGAILFNDATLNLDNISLNNLMYCRGLFADMMELIQMYNGVGTYSAITYVINVAGSIAHISYLVLSSLCISSLLKSLSRQSARFPEKRIAAQFITFVIFVVCLTFVTESINNVMFAKYVETIGQDAYAALDPHDEIIISEKYRVFFFRGGMFGSIVISVPTLLYSIFTSKYLVRRKFN